MQISRLFSLLFASALLCGFVSVAHADSEPAKVMAPMDVNNADSDASGISNEALDQLAALIEPLQNLRAVFSQQIHDADGVLQQESTGNLAIQRSGEFAWHIDEPFLQSIISDNENLWVYDPDLEQVTIKPVNRSLLETPLLLFTGNKQAIALMYEVSEDKERSTEQTTFFVLRPNNETSLYEQLWLQFENTEPRGLVIMDSLQQTTTLNFTDVLLNSELPATLFTFEPPAGIDIIRE